MNTVISAFACCENRGSERELGWKCLKEYASSADSVHLFTSGYMNPGIQEQVKQCSLGNVDVHVVDCSEWFDSFLKSIPYVGHQVAAYVWEFWLFCHMVSRFGKKHFDLGVKSTYGSYRWPSFLWYFSKILHVDPLSGGGRFPLRFRRFFSPKAQRQELLRMFMQRATLLDPFVLLTLFKAHKLYAGNSATKSILPRFARKKCLVKPDFITIDSGDFKMDEARASVSVDPHILKIFYTGKLLEWKGVKVILEALSLLPDNVKYEFTIMGNGPARKLYEDYSYKNQLNVVFIDPQPVPRCDLSFYFLSHDLFAFPTLHGEAGFAPVEAKLHGMILLTLDFSGLDFVLTQQDVCIATEGKDCGAVVHAMAEAIEEKYYQLKCHDVESNHDG